MLLKAFITTLQSVTTRIERPHLLRVKYQHCLGGLLLDRYYCIKVKMEEKNSQAAAEKSDQSAENTLSRRARKRLLTKERERKRKESKRSKHLVDSMSNNSDVLKGYDMNETEYYFEKGLRKVYPYHYEFSSYAKERWYGRTLIDVLTTEFRYTAAPVTESMANGLLTVNGEKTSADYKLKNNDYVQNRIHRHELPVVNKDIEIIADTDQVLVVNKPSSIPAHPCGRYHYNSLPHILAKDTGYKNLRSIYRLDRLTSGVVILCKVEGLARTMTEHIRDRKVQKEYICRVVGEFPSGVIECQEALDVFSPKVGLQKVTKNGKSAHTTFERMSYNGRSSVVKCMPHTGRTHQIRVHLQFLGYPIVNDPLYNDEAWGPNKGKAGEFGKSDEQLLDDLLKVHADDRFLLKPDDEIDSATTQEHLGKTTESSATVQDRTQDWNTANPTPVSDSNEAETRTDSIQAETQVFSEQMCSKVESCDRGMEDVTHSNKRPTSDCESERECKIQRCGEDSTDESLNKGTAITKDCTSKHEGEQGNNISDAGSSINRRPGFDQTKMTFDESCITCHQKFRDPHPQELVMFLHAYSYQGPGWQYTTSLPEWAQETWCDNQ